MTETVTAPWGILTSVLLCSWFLWCLRVRFKPAVGLFVVLGAVIVLGQGVKSLIKEQVQEPRPFVAWLEAEHHINNRLFYSLPRAERSELVRQQLQDQLIIPVWLSRHWQFETGFSFPSGHTVFAATWALLAVGLLWPRRHYKTVVFTDVMGTRCDGEPLIFRYALAAGPDCRDAHQWRLGRCGVWTPPAWVRPSGYPAIRTKRERKTGA